MAALSSDGMLQAGYGTGHPECGKDEVFICYGPVSEIGLMDLPGKRLGRMVFGDDGTDITEAAAQDRIVPVFANKAEHAKRYAN